MKKLILILLAIGMLAACGSGDGNGVIVSTGTAPVFSNATSSRTTATQNEGAGSVTVTFFGNFTDADGDLKSMTIESYDTITGALVSTQTVPITGVTNLTSGAISGSVLVGTTIVGTWNVKAYLTDVAGHNSNVINSTWTITAAQPT